MKKSINSILMLLILAVLGFNSARARDSVRVMQEDDIREAVFNYQFHHNESGQQENAGVYCLSLGENHDPSDQFMKRFEGRKPPVRKYSECSIHPNGEVTDIRTGKAGLVLQVGNIKWMSANEVEVLGGYYKGNLSASGNTYKVIKQKGKWKVSEDILHSVS